MNPVKVWFNECVAKDMVNILNKKHYNALYAQTADDAKKIILDMIPHGSSIAMGGSVTTMEMGLLDTFRGSEYKFFERYIQPTFDDVVEVYRQSMLADYLVTSTNAITKNGELVNTDCSGNRVAGMIFGPKKVIIVAGVNKVVNNIDDAFKRIKKIAPMNAKRLGHETPCSITGKCEDCNIHDRICNCSTIIHHGMKFKDRITVIMVAQEIGF